MMTYPDIDPIALQVGPIKVYWYGIMYLLGFAMAWGLAKWRAKTLSLDYDAGQVADLIFFAALGVVLGGRIGYVLFYNVLEFIREPWFIFQVWRGGMSFHGGLLGVVIALWCYARKRRMPFFEVADFIAPLVPLGLAAGRLGNFINGELWGRVSHMPWAVIHPDLGPQARHPSVIYEFLLEGIVLFIIIWWYSAKLKPRMRVSALFLILYGCFRFFVEFFREPDGHLGFIAFDWLTMGQLLSVPMILFGILFFYLSRGFLSWLR